MCVDNGRQIRSGLGYPQVRRPSVCAFVIDSRPLRKSLALMPWISVLMFEMAQLQKQRPTRSKILLLITLGMVLHFSAVPLAEAAVVVPAVAVSQLDPELKGQLLLEELNCAACHKGDASLAARAKISPRLSGIGSRVNSAYLAAYIGDPHGTKPGTTMPDALSSLDKEEKRLIATSLTHFLLSLGKSEFSLQAPDAVAAGQGKVLFHSRGCAACHAPRDERGVELPFTNSVPLGALDRKYSFKSLVEFLRQPHASRPSGRMPDLRLQGRDIERIAHFLLQDTRVPGPLSYTLYRGDVWEGLASEKVRAERAGLVQDFALERLGRVEQHTAIKYEGWIRIAGKGRYSFFLTMNGGSLSVDGREILAQEPSDRRGTKELEGAAELEAGWRKLQLVYFHTGREPKFNCEMAGPEFPRQRIPSSMLSISRDPIPVLESFKVDAGLAARGREEFGKRGCANCHDDLKVPTQPATAFAKLDVSRGCLGGTAGAWPRFDLSAEQRGWMARALPHAEKPHLTDRQQVDKTLVAFNCIACHERKGLGGIAPERNALFTGTQLALGDQGRLPPPLTEVGAKLTPEWIEAVLLRGERHRTYLDAAMPQFGEAQVRTLVELFGKVDQLEPAPLPLVADLKASKQAGHLMVGTEGFVCIACHEFNGQKPGEISALDIAQVTGRLQKNWFHHFLRQPSRFHPTIIMPAFWPGGTSTRTNILGGDTALQIESIWNYLEDGARARKPVGLSRQSNELRVGDVTEVCRGQSPAGYRGIGVGYPERINLAFDAGEMALRQLWKGEFASVDLGHFRPRGTDVISLPPGIPFHRLKTMEENWPYKGKTNHAFPQDHGYKFGGYHLDAARRPTLFYRYGDVAVEDYFEDVRDKDGNAYFRRTLRFAAATAPAPFHFRAAAGKKVVAHSDRRFGIDTLQLRITSDHAGMVRDGEVLIPLTLPAGRSTLTLEYQW